MNYNKLNTTLENKKLLIQKLIFINNALEDGWKIEKYKQDVYKFKKKKIDNSILLNQNQLLSFIEDNSKYK